MKEFLFNLIRKHKYEISVYTADIFERRCQEEIIRSDEDNSSFVYLEFDFEELRKEIPEEDRFILFWETFLNAIGSSRRASDVIGFLENDAGIGMLLLDSKMDGWNRVRGRIEQKAEVLGFAKMHEVLENLVRPILYPTSIQNQMAETAG